MREVLRRTARSTGAVVVLVDNRDGSFETFEGQEYPHEIRWATVCDTHGNYCLHATRPLATSFIACPEEWCDGCREVAA